MNIYESDTSRWEVEIKADNSPVTVADREANRVICDALQVSCPLLAAFTGQVQGMHKFWGACTHGA